MRRTFESCYLASVDSYPRGAYPLPSGNPPQLLLHS